MTATARTITPRVHPRPAPATPDPAVTEAERMLSLHEQLQRDTGHIRVDLGLVLRRARKARGLTMEAVESIVAGFREPGSVLLQSDISRIENAVTVDVPVDKARLYLRALDAHDARVAQVVG